MDRERREGKLTSDLDIAGLSHPIHLSSEADEGRGMGRMGSRRGGEEEGAGDPLGPTGIHNITVPALEVQPKAEGI